jgi:hypothetical protein
MSEIIGEAAGLVWQALSGNGIANAKELSRKTGLKPKQLERAIGWLAREKKLQIVNKDGKEEISLLEG